MKKRTIRIITLTIFAQIVVPGAILRAPAQGAKTPYPAMAPVEQYRVASMAEEVERARSAAPESVSGEA